MGRSVTVQARAVARRRSAIQFNTLLHHNSIRPRGLALPRPDGDSAGRECRGTEERESAGRRARTVLSLPFFFSSVTVWIWFALRLDCFAIDCFTCLMNSDCAGEARQRERQGRGGSTVGAEPRGRPAQCPS